MSFRDLLLPSRRNAYRPALLSKDTLTLLFAVTLLCEGFLWGGLAAGNLGGASLSAAAVQAGGQSYLQQGLRVLGDPKIINTILGGVGAFLTLVLAFTFFTHVQIQPLGMLSRGLAVALVAFGLLALILAMLEPVNVELVASPAHSNYPLVMEE